MREFLDKLQEDQRRMRKYLRGHAIQFKRMGDVLAKARKSGMRVFVIAEPPLEGVVRVIAEEYFTFLPALPIELQHSQPLSVDSEDGPAATAREAGAKQAGRHFQRGDVLLAFLFDGEDRETRIVLEAARAKRCRVLIVAGMGAKSGHAKRIAKVLLALPTRGVKTVCESSFVCSRILARVSRASWRGTGEVLDELRLVQVSCGACKEQVFFEEPQLGRKAGCPLCGVKMLVPRDAVRRAARADATAAEPPKRKRKLKPSVMELPTLRLDDLDDIDETPSSADGSAASASPTSASARSASASASASEPEEISEEAASALPDLSDRVPKVSERISGRASAPDPCFGSDIMVGSDIVSATPTSEGPPAAELATNATASAEPFAFDDGFLAEVQVSPLPGSASGGASSHSSHDESMPAPSRRVSARYTISQCHLRWGRGGYPDDAGPEHELVRLDTTHLSFVLNPDDEAGHTLQTGDELYVRVQIPAFLEPILVRASLEEISGASGNGGSTVAELVFHDVTPKVRRNLARASENLGAGV